MTQTRDNRLGPEARLRALVEPKHTVVLTQECQKGVLGQESKRPELFEAAKASGALVNMGRVVAAGRDAGCGVIHAIAAHREDLRGSNTNARLFTAIARDGLQQTVGTPLAELIEQIVVDPRDIFSVRLHGISPIAGTDVDPLLRNLGARTTVIVGVSTNLGVTNAVFDALNLGYNVVVVRDAVVGLPVSYSELVIENTLKLVATVTTCDALVAAWTAGSSPPAELR